MNNDFRIEKDRVCVVVVTTGGERLQGDMFVQSYTRHRMGSEEPSDILNGHEPYFPLASGGDTLLVAKGQVREVEVIGEPRESPENVGARPATIEVVLPGGVVRSGRVYLEVPFDRPRLLDYLNRYLPRFLALHTDDGVRLINSALVERVRPLD